MQIASQMAIAFMEMVIKEPNSNLHLIDNLDLLKHH